MSRYVIGDAAKALQADGRFTLAPPKRPGELSQAQAEALAAIYPEQFGIWRAARLQQEHGDAIVMEALEVCGRTYYARSAFTPLPAAVADASPQASRLFGPWWLVTLCGPGNRPQLHVAVSAYATELRIEEGRILLPKSSGEEFAAEGIPREAGFDFVEAPEQAVRRMGEAVSRRVTHVPELIVPLRADGFPNHPRWRLRLDSPVRAQGRAAIVSRSDLASWRRPGGAQAEYQVPLEPQPAAVPFRYPDWTSQDATTPPRYLDGVATRLPEVPVLFETATLLGD